MTQAAGAKAVIAPKKAAVTGIQDITSTGGTVTITDPTGPTTNLEVAGVLSTVRTDVTTPITLVPGQLEIANTGSAVFNVPAVISVGQIFGVQRGTAVGTLTLTANTGQSINGGATGGSVTLSGTGTAAQAGLLILLATSATTLIVLSAVGTDFGEVTVYNGAVFLNGNASFAGRLTFSSRFIGHQRTVAGTDTTQAGDWWIRATSGTFVETLSSANAVANQEYRITNEGVGVVTATPSTGTINGVASLAIAANTGVTVLFDGTNWHTV